jgi:hypothetical protein
MGNMMMMMMMMMMMASKMLHNGADTDVWVMVCAMI